MTTFYDVLKVAPNAETATIKKAYYLLALKHHPDKCENKDDTSLTDANVLFQRIVEAYETLSDPKKRAVYDKSLQSAPKKEANVAAKRTAPAPEQHQPPKKAASNLDPRPNYRFVPENIPRHDYEFTIHSTIEEAYYYYWTMKRGPFVTKDSHYYAGNLEQLLKEIKELSQNRRDKQGAKFSDIDLQYWIIKKGAGGREYISIPTNKPRCVQFDLRIIRKTLNVVGLLEDSLRYKEVKTQDPLKGKPRFEQPEEAKHEAPNAAFDFNFEAPVDNSWENVPTGRPFDFYESSNVFRTTGAPSRAANVLIQDRFAFLHQIVRKQGFKIIQPPMHDNLGLSNFLN